MVTIVNVIKLHSPTQTYTVQVPRGTQIRRYPSGERTVLLPAEPEDFVPGVDKDFIELPAFLVLEAARNGLWRNLHLLSVSPSVPTSHNETARDFPGL